jgi:hypothetical protein
MPGVQPYSTVTPLTPVATGTTAVQIGGALGIAARTVSFRSSKANAAVVIYLGDATVLSAPSGNIITDLQPGEMLFLDIRNTNLVWAVSASACVLYVTAYK